MEIKAEPRALPPLWPYLALCAVLAVIVQGRDFHRANTSDSIVPVLCSLYKWTPYYWECNRIGMLVPLLALPFKSPLTNLLVQGWLVVFAGLGTFFMLARYVLRTPTWPLLGALAAGIFVAFSHLSFCFAATFGQPHYCVALALTVGGLLLCGPRTGGTVGWRLLGALGLLLLAVWVNSATPVIFAPLVVLRSLLRTRPTIETGATTAVRLRAWLCGVLDAEAILSLLLLCVAAGGGWLAHLALTVPHDPFDQGTLSPDEWLHGWGVVASWTWEVAVQPSWWAFLAVAASGGLLLFWPAVRRHAAGPLRAGFALTAGGLTYGLAMGTLRWVAANRFNFKYWIPVVFFTETALAVVALAPLAMLLSPRARRALCVLCAPLLLVLVTAKCGLPSRGRVRAALDQCAHGVPLATQTAEMLAGRTTHVVGTYGQVWMSVFHCNLVLYERGQDRHVWGVGGRCNPTWGMWGSMPPEDLRVAGLLDEPGAAPHLDVISYMNDYFPPMVVVAKGSGSWSYRPAYEMPWPPSASGAVLASWHHGFYGYGFFDNIGELWYFGRWCGRSTGKLTLNNTADRPLPVTLSFQPRTGHLGPANLWIDSPLYHAQMPIYAFAPAHQANIVVPPGKHLVCFSCDAPPTPHPYGLRPQYFFLGEVTLSVQDRSVAAPIMH
jgi:hypothetical protein